MHTQELILPLIFSLILAAFGAAIYCIRRVYKNELKPKKDQEQIPQAWTNTHRKPLPIYRNPMIYDQPKPIKDITSFKKLEKRLDETSTALNHKTIAESIRYFRAELLLTLEYWHLPKYNPIYQDLDRLFQFFTVLNRGYEMNANEARTIDLINYAMYWVITRELSHLNAPTIDYNPGLNYHLIYLNSFGDRDWRIKTFKEKRESILRALAQTEDPNQRDELLNTKIKDITPGWTGWKDFYEKLGPGPGNE